MKSDKLGKIKGPTLPPLGEVRLPPTPLVLVRLMSEVFFFEKKSSSKLLKLPAVFQVFF